MTDLPDLQRELVAAAARRTVRRQPARVAARIAVAAVAAAVIAGLLVGLGAALNRGNDDREVPARPPKTVAARITDAYGVFRRAARPADHVTLTKQFARFQARARLGHLDRSRLITRHGDRRLYLVAGDASLCLLTEVNGGVGGGCAPARGGALNGRQPIGSYSDEPGPSDIAFAFPDAVTSATLTLADGQVLAIPIRNNGFLRHVPARPARLEWRAPDGRPAQLTFQSAPPFDAADFYSELKRPARNDDALAGAPDARRIDAGNGAIAWIAPRPGSICVILSSPRGLTTGCHGKVADVRRALIVFSGPIDHSSRVLAAAFADGIQQVTLINRNGTRRTVHVRDNGILVTNARDVDRLSYRSPGGTQELDRLPSSATTGVVNGNLG